MTDLVEAPAAPVQWILCPACRSIHYAPRWRRSLGVCPDCEHHSRVDARTRILQLADEGSVETVDLPSGTVPDHLGFVDTMPYPERLARARSSTGLDAAVLVAVIRVEGSPVVAAVMDFNFMGGSLGSVAGEAITRAARKAIDHGLPLLVVPSSGGARMQEGAISLMQLAKTSAAWAELDEAGLLTISLITDPTYGGVAASFASLSDVIIGEKGARLGFAGRRVIEQTIRQRLPKNFQTVEFMQENGFVDIVAPRSGLREVIGRLLRTGGCPDPEAPAPRTTDDTPVIVTDAGRLPVHEAWRQVRRARDLSRPTTQDYLALAFDDFQELRGDRAFEDCRAMLAGLARLDGRPVAVIGQQKGHIPNELREHSFGMPSPAGYRKAGRVMRLAAKLGLPVVTLVDTPGAFPGEKAEQGGQASAIAETLRLMTSLPVPVVSVITGEGGSGGALGIAVANTVLMWEHAVYSVISPEGCASILWGDAAKSATAAAALGLTSRALLELGVVDGVLPEPGEGVGTDPLAAADRLRRALTQSLDGLALMSGEELVKHRRVRFHQFGSFQETQR